MPNYLGHADNYIPANPAVTPAHIVPEWYYLPFYAILRAIPNKLLRRASRMFGSIVILAFLPWLDTSRVRSARYRPLYRQFFWMFVAVCLGLGWLGAKPAEGGYVIAVAHPDGLLLRPLPDHPAAARLVREDQAAAELDRRVGAEGGRAGRRVRPRADDQALRGRPMTTIRSSPSFSPARCWALPFVAPAFAAEDAPQPPRRSGRSPARSASSIAAQLQRGFKVYREVCAVLPRPDAACRSAISPSRAAPASPTAQAAAVAAEYKIKDGPNDAGRDVRARRPAGRPFPDAVRRTTTPRARRQRRRAAAGPLGDGQGAHL